MAQRESRMNVTEAREHFGELLQRASNGEAIIVERDGREQVVVISMEEYREKCRGRMATGLREQIQRTHALIRAELGDRELTPAERIIDEARAVRDASIDAMR